MRFTVLGVTTALFVGFAGMAVAQADLREQIDARAALVEEKVIAWRRDIHQHPELGNREVRTAGIVAEHLRALGLDKVETDVAHTGVVGVLNGGKPGPVVALRADMDALPVTEQVDVPFASKVRTTYAGREVGVMHACGHDAHTAILMGVAEVLAGMRQDLPGTVKFIFQPAEEGAPPGEEGGASLMVAEGVLSDPKPDAVFGLHTFPAEAHSLAYRTGGAMAGADGFRMTVTGKQTHGAMPSQGIDPITVAAQIIQGLQMIPARQTDARNPVVISVGSINGGVRFNIIPDEVKLTGTIRILEPSMRDEVLMRIRRTTEKIAESAGATATIEFDKYAPVTYNDPALTARMVPTLKRIAGERLIAEAPPIMASEDFAYFQEKVPGVYFFLGVNKEGVAFGEAAPNHSPHYFVNEDTLKTGVRAMAHMAVDYLTGAGG